MSVRKDVEIVCWLIGVALNAIWAGPFRVASLTLCAHMEVGAPCAMKAMTLLVKPFTHPTVWYGGWVSLPRGLLLLLGIWGKSRTSASYTATKTVDRAAEARGFAGVLVGACRGHMFRAAACGR